MVNIINVSKGCGDMSFAKEVKEEILRRNIEKRCCGVSWLVAVVRNNANIEIQRDIINIVVQTKNALIARKIFELTKTLYGCTPSIAMKKIYTKTVYTVRITNKDTVRDMLAKSGIQRYAKATKYSNIQIAKCCQKAYISGLFLVNGSINCPNRSYHLEITNTNEMLAIQNKEILKEIGIDFKMVERKGMYVLYIKDGESIVNFLNIVKAHKALMQFENVRVVKAVKNDVNRVINCETANLEKIVNTSVRQVKCIEYIERTIGINKLPLRLREIARIRLDNKELSLKDLGQMLAPRLGKSGVNYRLKKIEQIAMDLMNKAN